MATPARALDQHDYGLRDEVESWGRIFWRRFKRNRLAHLGFIAMLVMVAMAVFAPWLATHDPEATDIANRLEPPSREHWFGTDRYGRDVFSRMLYGARVSLTVGLVAVGIAVSIGTLIGALAGYFGGVVDNVLMRFVDIVISLPGLMFLILVVSLFGRGMMEIILVLGLLSWTGVARLVRGEFLSLREREFAEAARAAGASDLRLIFRHLLPNALAPIIVAATLGVAGAIITEAGLSYLGLGVAPPAATWGNMLQEGQSLIRRAWWLVVFPGAAIFITVLSFNLIGDALRDALDPRLKD